MATGALDPEPPSARGDPVRQPGQPRAPAHSRPPYAVVGHADYEGGVLTGDLQDDLIGPRVLDRVGQALGGYEVGRRLDIRRKAVGGRRHFDGHRRPARQVAQRRAEARLEQGRPQPVRQLPQVLDRGTDLHDGVVQRRLRLGGVGTQLVLGVPQREADGDQALLGAVVQVALDAPTLLVSHGGEPGPRLGHFVETPAQLDPEARHLDRQDGCRDNAREQCPPLLTRRPDHLSEDRPTTQHGI